MRAGKKMYFLKKKKIGNTLPLPFTLNSKTLFFLMPNLTVKQ